MQVWLNGRVMPVEAAHISPLDRGFLFGDGIYELVRFFDGVGMAMEAHLTRLERSLSLSGILGFNAHQARHAMQAVLQANRLADAAVYLQVTRGAAPTRSHIPPTGLAPTVFAFASPCPGLASLSTPAGIRVSVQPDDRWRRCEIKSISLMGSILPMLAAGQAGAEEAVLVRDGLLSEGSSSNVLLVRGETVSTPPIDADPAILRGTMRDMALHAARASGLRVEERPVSAAELDRADEVLIASSRRVLAAVSHLDGRAVATPVPGPVACRLLQGMREQLQASIRGVTGASRP
ncbi:MAG: hypothetical protein RLZZ558_309 [Planctomycetota bacterium]